MGVLDAEGRGKQIRTSFVLIDYENVHVLKPAHRCQIEREGKAAGYMLIVELACRLMTHTTMSLKRCVAYSLVVNIVPDTILRTICLLLLVFLSNATYAQPKNIPLTNAKEITGCWARIDFSGEAKKMLNEIEPWPSRYQWFCFEPDGTLVRQHIKNMTFSFI